MIDFATLTGSMHVALGSRYSGAFGNRDDLLEKALLAGKSSGERIWAFPSDQDYDVELESRIADIKQCTLEGEADHILATRFLSRFVGDLPWLHMDLSASNHKGGLGAVGTDVTGFGVSWGIDLLTDL
jgi:leucyl aminopeptidase